MRINLDEAQLIIDKHFPTQSVVSLALLHNNGYSDEPNLKTYVINLRPRTESTAVPVCSCFLSISSPRVATGLYHSNSLPLIAQLLTLIRTQIDVPISESTLDTSLELIPYHYLLSAICPTTSENIISLSEARRSGVLSTVDNLTIDLLLGQFLGQLHSGVQNHWYGLPLLDGKEPSDMLKTWEETFTSLLDDLLTQIESREDEYNCRLPYEDIRLYLSRAIGASLFEDVDEASLVWFTGSEDDIYITVSPEGPAVPGRIAAILPNVAHALWGDPLLECFMMGKGSESEDRPSAAFMEGYLGGGGKQLIVFPRQQTKRLWYTFFLALVILTKYGVPTLGDDNEGTSVKEKRTWARQTLMKCAEDLKDAPYRLAL